MTELVLAAAITIVVGVLSVAAAASALTRLPKGARVSWLAASLVALGALLAMQPSYGLWMNLVTLAASAAGASWIGPSIRSHGALIAFLAVVAIVDFLSFSGGLTASISETYRRTGEGPLLYLSVSVPLENHLQPIAGVSDFMIGAAVAIAMRQLRFSRLEAIAAPLSGLLGAMVIGIIVGGIYALPFLALSVGGWTWVRRNSTPRQSPTGCTG
jgi:hypothetical protein